MKRSKSVLVFLLWAGASAWALPARKAPTISLSTGTLTINAPELGPAPAPSLLTLQNSGDGKLNWTATSSASWLQVSPTSGNLHRLESIDLSVSVTLSGLAAGTYTGTLLVSDPASSNGSQTCAVTLHVNGSARIGLSPASISWTAPLGGANPAGQPLTVQNTGSGTLSWSAAFAPAWLSASSSSGNLSAGASQTVTLFADTAGLSAGSHSGTVTITAAGAVNTPQTVGVTLTISQAPVIGLTPSSLTFDAPQGGANPGAKSISLTNQGGGTLAWSASTNAAWLSVSPPSGTLVSGTPQTLAVSVNTSGLTEGTYLASVQIAATGATNTPQAVPVTLNVNALPKIGANPKTLAFSVSSDSGISSPSAVSVTNTGSGTLAWSASCAVGWLEFSPVSGSLGVLASEPFLLTVRAGGLNPGHYTTTVQIADSNAVNSPQTIAVDLTVTASELPVNAPAGQCGLLGLEMLAFGFLRFLRRRQNRNKKEMPWS